MKSKNAQGNELWYVIIAVIVIAVLVISFFTLRKTGIAASEIVLSEDTACKAQGDSLSLRGTSFADKDNDIRPDSCDICICTKADCSSTNTDNSIDEDGDGVPKGCDLDDSVEGGAGVGMCYIQGKDCRGTKCCKEDSVCGPFGGKLVKYQSGYRCIIS